MQKNTAEQFQKLQRLFRDGKALPFLWVFVLNSQKHTTNLRATGKTGGSFTNFELIESNAAALRNLYRHYTTEPTFFFGANSHPEKHTNALSLAAFECFFVLFLFGFQTLLSPRPDSTTPIISSSSSPTIIASGLNSRNNKGPSPLLTLCYGYRGRKKLL